MLSLECQFVQYTNEPLDLSFDTVSCIQVRFSPKAFGGRGRMKCFEILCSCLFATFKNGIDQN
jgi:hypothetical protein